jgi:hypothetical protein
MIRRALMFLLLSVALQVDSDSISAAAGSQKQSLSCSSTELNEYDAEILLYMLPASLSTRASGRKAT